MKKLWLFTAMSVFVVGCANTNTGDSSSSTSSSASSSVTSSSSSSSVESSSQNSSETSSSESSSQASSSSEGQSTEATQRIGSDAFGFVSVPENWKPYQDMRGSSGVQYSDESAQNIVTLNRIEEENIPAEHTGHYTAEMAAQEFYQAYQESSSNTNVTLSEASVASSKAHAIRFLEDGTVYNTVLLFDGADGMVYYIVFEGTQEGVEKMEQTIPSTWLKTQ